MRANAVAEFIANAPVPKVWSIGTVTAHTASTVSVAWQGDSFDMHYLQSYSPTNGDVVFFIRGGQQLFCLGAIS